MKERRENLKEELTGTELDLVKYKQGYIQACLDFLDFYSEELE